MRTLLLLFALFASIVSLAGELPSMTIWTNPKTFLAEFPVGTTEAEVMAKYGIPKRTMDGPESAKMWVYERGQDYGLRTFTFIIREGSVVDVLYNDQGPYNGLTATKVKASATAE